MTRACLDCGTPKFAAFKVCVPCGKPTLDYDGPARRSLCSDCKFYSDEGCLGLTYSFMPVAHYATANRSLVMSAIQTVTTPKKAGPKVTRHLHDCEFFDATSRDYKPSPHPLSYHDRLDIGLYQFNPLAFWLDPQRWDHVPDPRQKAMGYKPPAATPVKTIGLVALAAAALLFGLQRPASTQ